MNSIDNGGPLDQLLAKARELAGEEPEARRRLVVDFVMGRLELGGVKERLTRIMVERVYDGIFSASSRNQKLDASGCPHCGLNDGHHYVGCKTLKRNE